MAEYIDKKYACSHPFANGHYDKSNANRDFIRGHESYKEWLEDLPAADVRENVVGTWIKGRPDKAGKAVSDMKINSFTVLGPGFIEIFAEDSANEK